MHTPLLVVFASTICACCRSCLTSQYSSASSRLFSWKYSIWSASSCRPKRPSSNACSRRNDKGSAPRSRSDRIFESGQLKSRRSLNLYFAPRLVSTPPSSSPRSEITPSRSRYANSSCMFALYSSITSRDDSRLDKFEESGLLLELDGGRPVAIPIVDSRYETANARPESKGSVSDHGEKLERHSIAPGS